MKYNIKPLPNVPGVKGNYSILHNANGEIIVMIEAREGEPEDPLFICDGKIALLIRALDSPIVIRNIEQEALKRILNVSEVLVVEILGDDADREYTVPVIVVDDVNRLIR